jgi:hypothetical protein
VEREVTAGQPDREHVLDRDDDAAPLLQSRQVLDQPPTEPALPLVGRVDDDHRDPGPDGGVDRPVDLRDRVRGPHLPGEQQAGRVDRADAEPELAGQRRDPARVLAVGILRDHHLDRLVAGLGGQAEGPRQRPREEGGRGEQDRRGSHRARC